MTTLLSRAALAAAAMALGLSGAYATSDTSKTLAVNLQVTGTCTVTGGSINFPNTPGQDVNGSGTITVNCPSGTWYNIGLGNGLHYESNTRQMLSSTDGSSKIGYKLYQDTNRSNAWDLSNIVRLQGTGNDVATTVYAQASASSAVPGLYNDSVQIKVDY